MRINQSYINKTKLPIFFASSFFLLTSSAAQANGCFSGHIPSNTYKVCINDKKCVNDIPPWISQQVTWQPNMKLNVYLHKKNKSKTVPYWSHFRDFIIQEDQDFIILTKNEHGELTASVKQNPLCPANMNSA